MSPRQLKVTYIGGPMAVFESGGLRLLTDPGFDPPGGQYKTGPVVLTKTAGLALVLVITPLGQDRYDAS